MPIPQIIVYVWPEDDKVAQIINNFDQIKFIPLVDSINRENYHYYKLNFDNDNARLYAFSNNELYELKFSDLVPEMEFTPDLSITFNMDVENIPWDQINVWLAKMFSGNVVAPPEFIELPVTDSANLPQYDITEMPKTPTEYEFRLLYNNVLDIMIYEVIKPHTDLPYTTITRAYNTNGHLPFFSSLFIAESWGVCSADIAFLHRVWQHLEMQGEYKPEELYRERVEKCREGAPEPEVYRRSLEHVLKLVIDESNGIVCGHNKRKMNIPDDIKKKNKVCVE